MCRTDIKRRVLLGCDNGDALHLSVLLTPSLLCVGIMNRSTLCATGRRRHGRNREDHGRLTCSSSLQVVDCYKLSIDLITADSVSVISVFSSDASFTGLSYSSIIMSNSVWIMHRICRRPVSIYDDVAFDNCLQ